MVSKASLSVAEELVPDQPQESFNASAFLFGRECLGEYESALAKGIESVRNAIARAENPFTGVLPAELATQFDGVNLDEPSPDLDAALRELDALYLRDAVYFHHPRYVAHLNCPIAVPAILAEVILSSVNSSLDTWDQSVGGTLIEQKLVDWTARKIGYGKGADGVFTSGGTQSNLMAMLLARDVFCAEHLGLRNNKTQGLPEEFRRLRILVSEASHFSIRKAAAILGLGYDAVVPVACDEDHRLDPAALEREIVACRANGLLPMAVVATAGTTDFGSIDPLSRIAAVCRSHGLWLHADAAYGCGLLVSSRRRHWLDGLEHADSVTVDYHKSFFQPVSCGAFLVRDGRHLDCMTCHADYLNPRSQRREGTPNQVDKTIQTTRRFDALKLWLTLRTVGPKAIGDAFDQAVDLATEAYDVLAADPEIEVAHAPELSTLVFRYQPGRSVAASEVDAANGYIRKALFRSGEAVIAGTRVEGRQYLKFTLLNPATSVEDLRAIVTLITTHGRDYFRRC